MLAQRQDCRAGITAPVQFLSPYLRSVPAARRTGARPAECSLEVRVFVNGVYTLKQSKNLSALGLDQRGPRSPSVGDSVNHERRTLNSRRLEVDLAYSR